MDIVGKSYGNRRDSVGFGGLLSGQRCAILKSGRPLGGPREFGPGSGGGGPERRIGECENIIRQVFLIFFYNFF